VYSFLFFSWQANRWTNDDPEDDLIDLLRLVTESHDGGGGDEQEMRKERDERSSDANKTTVTTPRNTGDSRDFP